MSLPVADSDIQEFYNGKSVFITGCTGYLGKVLLEKLLRSCPGVETIYVLVRNKKGKDMYTRIEEICSGDIFENLSKQQPKFRQKVIGIKGDISMEGLGMDATDRKMLTEKVSIIFHVAATVRFDEILNSAVAINVQGIKEIINLGKDCKTLESLMHVSTAFSHCHQKRIEEKFYPPPCDPQKIITIAQTTPEDELPTVTKSLMSKWPNTYTLTKAVSEEVVRLNGVGLPICVFRPAIVTAAHKEPIAGWIDNINGPSGVIAGAGAGLIRVVRGNSECLAELVPVDLVVNSMIAISYKTAKTIITDDIPVYNYVSSPQNPLRWQNIFDYCLKYGKDIPSEKTIWCYSFRAINNGFLFSVASIFLHYIPAVLVDTACVLTGRKAQFLKVYKKVAKFTNVLTFFTSREWEFTNDNTRQLWSELSIKDKEEFPFDINTVEWEDYHKQQLYGIRKFVLKEDISTLPAAKRKYFKLKMIHRTFTLILAVLLINLIYYVLKRFFQALF